MELLTGQCNKDFKKWFLKQEYGDLIGDDIYYGINSVYGVRFWNMPLSMQWGVFVDFFDSVDIFIVKDEFFEARVDKLYRKAARVKVIKAANELYNKRHLNNIEVQHEEIKEDE